MKKLIKCLLLIVAMLFTYTVNAEVIDKDDVPNGTYVIGTHTFDRNKTDNYDGTLTVQHIMLAAKTIESNNLEDMKIYFKNSRGKWMNPIDNSIIADTNIPEQFEVVYQNVEKLILYGDVNNDGEVNGSDLILLSQYLDNEISLSSSQLGNADINGDNDVNEKDLVLFGAYLNHEIEGNLPNESINKEVYKVTYKVNSNIYDEKLVVEGTKTNFVDVVENGFKLGGWYLNGNLFNFETLINNNITLVARTYHDRLLDLANSFPDEVIANVNSEIEDTDLIEEFIGKKYLFDNNAYYDKISVSKESIRTIIDAESNSLTVIGTSADCGGLTLACGGGVSVLRENAAHYNINHINLSQNEITKLNEFKSEVNQAVQNAKSQFNSGMYSKLFITNEIVKNVANKYGYDVLSDNYKYYELGNMEFQANNEAIRLGQSSDIYLIVKDNVLYAALSFEDDYNIGIYVDNTEYKNTNIDTTLNQAVANFVEATGITNYNTVLIDGKNYDS